MDKTPLLADSQVLGLESLTTSDTQVVLVVKTIRSSVPCPRCHQASSRVHSHYHRTVADLPWQGVRVQLQLATRRFFCVNQGCKQRIFCERLPRVVATYGRQTVRLNDALHLIGLRLGGQAGASLAMELGMLISPDTLLRRIRQSSLTAKGPPRVVGVDDWAWRKGRRYGTLLVDLERHRPIALLADREPATLTSWLLAHPGVEIVARDRSKAYQKGIRQGAPHAIQVADRFHLLQNLAEALEQVFSENVQALKAFEVSARQVAAIVSVPPPAIEPADQVSAQHSRARRLATYQQVWDLHTTGWTQKAIAQHLGIGVRSIYRYLHSSTFAERRERKDRGHSHLDPYKPYLLKRWNDGCHQAKLLFEELKAHGAQTSYGSVARYVRCIRQAQGVHPQQEQATKLLPRVSESQREPLTPRRAVWLVLRCSDLRKPEDEQLLRQLMAQHPHLAEAVELAQGFAQMVRQRQPQQLEPWLAQASESTLSPFRRFAKGLSQDYDALKAGVTLPWSNGQTEGQVNRLKMLKRQMFGRAGIELLSRRFLLAA